MVAGDVMLFSERVNGVQQLPPEERRPSGRLYRLLNRLPMGFYSALIVSLLLAYYVVILCATVCSLFLLANAATQLWDDLDAKGLVVTGSLLLVVLTLIGAVFGKNSS